MTDGAVERGDRRSERTTCSTAASVDMGFGCYDDVAVSSAIVSFVRRLSDGSVQVQKALLASHAFAVLVPRCGACWLPATTAFTSITLTLSSLR